MQDCPSIWHHPRLTRTKTAVKLKRKINKLEFEQDSSCQGEALIVRLPFTMVAFQIQKIIIKVQKN